MKIETFRKKFRYFTSVHFEREGFSRSDSCKLNWMTVPTISLKVRGAGELRDIWFHSVGGRRVAVVSYDDGAGVSACMLGNVRLNGYSEE